MTFSFQIWNAIDHGASPAALTCSRPQIYRVFMIFHVQKHKTLHIEKKCTQELWYVNRLNEN